MMLKLIKFTKDAILFFPITLVLSPLSKAFLFIAHLNKLIRWIYNNKSTLLYNDFYSPLRSYSKRFQLYAFLTTHYQLENESITYLEFGVASGVSFNWWKEKNKQPNSYFFGFDTFEGLPEDWGGIYKKGAMAADMPEMTDPRTKFIKGLFQDTLNDFIDSNLSILQQKQRKIIHLDADLYTATAFTLSQLARFLKKDDLILFDEFSVPLHEFKAFSEFTSIFPVKLKPVAAVNNFYQTAFIVG